MDEDERVRQVFDDDEEGGVSKEAMESGFVRVGVTRGPVRVERGLFRVEGGYPSVVMAEIGVAPMPVIVLPEGKIAEENTCDGEEGGRNDRGEDCCTDLGLSLYSEL